MFVVQPLLFTWWQNAEEFEQAVHDTANAGGQLDEMVRIQNESLMSQIQILKNNAAAIFLMRDATFEGTEFLNGFHKAVVEGVQALKDLLVVEGENGAELTAFGLQLQDLAINGIGALASFIKDDLIPIMKDFSNSTMISKDMIEVYLLPLKTMAFIIDKLGADVVKAFVAFNILNSIFPITAAMSALAGSGFFTMAAGADTSAAAVARVNMQLMGLRLTLMSLATIGGLGLGLLAIGAYNKSVGSEDGLGVKTYDRVEGFDYGRLNPLGTPYRDGQTHLEAFGPVDYMSKQNYDNAHMISDTTTMNVQNLNIDPYGGNS